MDAILDFGLEVTKWLQTNYPQLEGFFQVITSLGLTEFYLALFPLLYWCLDKRMGKHVAYLFLLSGVINTVFKHALRGPRPFWLDSSLQLSTEDSYGIPSGHTQYTAVIYLFLAQWIRERWLTILAIFLVLAMMMSRIYLGVHFVHDTLAGLLLALLTLTGHYLSQHYLAKKFEKRILGQKLLIFIAIPLVLGLLYTLIRLLIGDPDRSVAWAEFIPAAELSGIESMATFGGALLGIGVGIILEESRVRFLVIGPLWKRALRYFLGMIITFAIWQGLGSAFEGIDILWLSLPLRTFRYVLTTFWVGYYAPMLFVRIGLATAEPDPGIKLSMYKEQ